MSQFPPYSGEIQAHIMEVGISKNIINKCNIAKARQTRHGDNSSYSRHRNPSSSSASRNQSTGSSNNRSNQVEHYSSPKDIFQTPDEPFSEGKYSNEENQEGDVIISRQGKVISRQGKVNINGVNTT